MPEPAKRDPNAPKFLEITVKDHNRKEWKTFFCSEKQFSTGSIGYYASEKVENPESHERYQISLNIALIGSKPK